MRFSWLLLLLFLSLLLGTASAALADSAQSVQEGQRLYAEHCASCHRPLEKTTKAQRSATRLRSANRQFPAMFKLDALTDSQLAAIAAALKTIPL